MATTARVVFSGRIGGGSAWWAPTSLRLGRAHRGELTVEASADAEQFAGAEVEHVAAGVERNEGGDGDPVGEHDAGRTDATFQSFGVGSGACADRALGDLGGACRRGSTPAECRVRRVVEATADTEIEQHGGGDDRNHLVRFGSNRVAAIALGEPAHDAVGGGESVGAAAGEADGVDALDEVDRVEQVGLACAGRAAADVDTSDGAWRREHDRRAGEPAAPAPLVVADADPGDVGEVVV